jgi:hypothetical protein
MEDGWYVQPVRKEVMIFVVRCIDQLIATGNAQRAVKMVSKQFKRS